MSNPIESAIQAIEESLREHEAALRALRRLIQQPREEPWKDKTEKPEPIRENSKDMGSEEKQPPEKHANKKPVKKRGTKHGRRASRRRYVTLNILASALADAGEPMTPFKLRNKLADELGLSVTEEKLKEMLTKDKGTHFDEPEQGFWTAL